MLCVLIMAGGMGTRFWPLSTEKKPKQFLNLLGEKTMIQMTVERIKDLIPMERIFVVTGKKYKELVKDQLSDLPEQNIIIEPFGKNTAPCIALSAFTINKKYDNATIAVLPSDHLILDEEKFRDTLKIADRFVYEHNEAIVTIGMKPDRPETGYGYIKLVDYQLKSSENIYEVEKFVEKPCLESAKKYVEQGNYLWNGGIFVWTAKNIINLTKTYLNNTYKALLEITFAEDNDYCYS